VIEHDGPVDDILSVPDEGRRGHVIGRIEPSSRAYTWFDAACHAHQSISSVSEVACG
jgi:hypothetical protein